MTAKIKLNAASGGESFSLQAASSSSNNRVFTLPDSADATLLTSTASLGKVLQVVSAQKTDTFSTSASNQFVTVTGLTINITPSSASNKVFVCFNVNIGNGSTGEGMGGKIFRSSDSQNILRADSSSSRTRSYLAQFTCHSNTNNTTQFVSPSFLDSPNSTSQVSYVFQVFNGTNTTYINRSGEDGDGVYNARGASFAYAMEVAS